MFTLSDKDDKLLFLIAVFTHIARSEPGFNNVNAFNAINANSEQIMNKA